MTIEEFNAYPKHGGLGLLTSATVKTRQEWLGAYINGTSGFEQVNEMIAALKPTLLGWGEEPCFLHQWNFRHSSGFIVCDACGKIHVYPVKKENKK